MHRQPVDLLFLDINMPQMNGLQMLETLTHPPKVILATAHSEFALESYNYNVVDYLLKTIEFARFLKAVDKVVTAHAEEETQRVSLPVPTPASFVIKVDGDWVRLAHDDLLYGQSWGNYVKLFTTQQVYVTALTMTELEQRLPANQFYTHL
ncbi:LytR/AlgR family response regulator transcription factor [Spirosoma flavum]|uniref:LytR/AlgR family response regulator transcription factor n=1 Tax=Spirosoma flavum TaxID=2048557 RepID=A0ABW6ALJ1_9BACT